MLHVNIIMLHVDIDHFPCRRQKYVIIITSVSKLIAITLNTDFLKRKEMKKEMYGNRHIKINTCILTDNVNKKSTGLNGHLRIRDFTPTSCQKGESYL